MPNSTAKVDRVVDALPYARIMLVLVDAIPPEHRAVAAQRIREMEDDSPATERFFQNIADSVEGKVPTFG